MQRDEEQYYIYRRGKRRQSNGERETSNGEEAGSDGTGNLTTVESCPEVNRLRLRKPRRAELRQLGGGFPRKIN